MASGANHSWPTGITYPEAAAFSYASDPTTGGYDALNRLGSFSRGTLNGTKDGMVGTADRDQDWSLDALGNWESVTSDGVTQTRTHDDQNRITSVSSATTPVHSANGEMTTDETGATYVYDAWGRLVSLDLDGDSSDDAVYTYDALFRKITVDEAEASGGESVWYHSQWWQVLEEREETSGDVEQQYVWSPVYVDALVLRDRDTDGDGDLTDAAGGGAERLYVQQDANFNVTSVADASGAVQERYLYDPYGTRTVLDADWSDDADNLSDSGFQHGHQGGRHDAAGGGAGAAAGAGLVNFRFRELDTSLGRWTRQDPAGYVDGASLLKFASSDPAGTTDPSGLNPLLRLLGKLMGQLKKLKPSKEGAKEFAKDAAAGAVGGAVVEGTMGGDDKPDGGDDKPDGGDGAPDGDDGAPEEGDSGSPGRHPIYGDQDKWPGAGVRIEPYDDPRGSKGNDGIIDGYIFIFPDGSARPWFNDPDGTYTFPSGDGEKDFLLPGGWGPLIEPIPEIFDDWWNGGTPLPEGWPHGNPL